MLLPLAAAASTTGAEFIAFYQFIYDAATGYLGRGIAITGGLVMMGVAAGTGKVVLAAAGMVLAIFGALGPTIIDQIFGSALIY
ncbi:MAG: conjugal transfer protein TraB [Gammaproteobacteria bacterium]